MLLSEARDGIRTELVSDALHMAWFRRHPEAGLIFHSDRGSQYCSHEFQSALTVSLLEKVLPPP